MSLRNLNFRRFPQALNYRSVSGEMGEKFGWRYVGVLLLLAVQPNNSQNVRISSSKGIKKQAYCRHTSSGECSCRVTFCTVQHFSDMQNITHSMYKLPIGQNLPNNPMNNCKVIMILYS